MNRNESFNNITDQDLYIQGDESDSPKNETPFEFSNISWASLVEEELGKSMEVEEKSLSRSCGAISFPDESSSSSITADQKTKPGDEIKLSMTPEEMFKVKFEDSSDVEILKLQTSMTGSLRKIINVHIDRTIKKEDSQFNKDEFVEKLEWISSGSEYLSSKIGLSTGNQQKKPKVTVKDKVIPRSSYQFCSHRHECEFNYDHEKHKGCFAQHFVHNLVWEDINVLISYLNSADNFEQVNFNQIKKCIDTLSFVLNHMATELTNLQYFNPGKVDQLHKDRTPSGKRMRRRNRKKNFRKNGQFEKTVKYNV